jgi:hypothetical protein
MSTDPVDVARDDDPYEGRCGARLVSGGHCRRYPIKGAKRCEMHGSGTALARAKAAANVLQAKINGELQLRGWEPVADPVTHYAELAGEILAFKDLAREQVNVLDDWALTIGHFTSHEDGESAFMAMAEQAKAVVAVYERALDRAERTLARMIGIGFTAHAHRLAEDRGGAFLGAMRAMLADPRVTVVGNPDDVLFDALKALQG